MFDQVMNTVKQYAAEAINNHPEVPADKKDAVAGEAGQSIAQSLQGLLTKGYNISDLAKGFGNNGQPASPAADGMIANFISSMVQKFGFSPDKAQSIAATVIPFVLSKLGNAGSLLGGKDGNGPNLGGLAGSLGGLFK